MRIMIASSTYVPAMNGQAVFTTNLAEGLAKRGHKVMVVLDSHQVRALTTYVNGVQIEELRSMSLNFIHAGVYFSPFPGKEVKQLFSTFQPEIVHIQDHYPTCRVVVQEARKRNIKLVGSNHFIPDNLAPYVPGLSKIKPLFNWVLWRWMSSVYLHVDAVSSQSIAAANLMHLQGFNMPILPISCGIDLSLYYPNLRENRRMYRQRYGIDLDKKVFFFLGRIDGEKRIDLLLRVMQQMKRADIQMVIAGHGKVENSLRQMAKDIGLHDKLKFTGFIPAEDLPGLLNSVDVFIMPSEAELLSISTLEAMACGRPVLLANALALPELVKVGVNGYLFSPGDVQDLMHQMVLLADHPERWEEMGNASHEIALEHNLDVTIQKFENLYLKLTSNDPAVEVKL
jgi:glycosyltransferase involved in cell wall biosynthesis